MATEQNVRAGEAPQSRAAPVRAAPQATLLQVKVWSPFRVYFQGEAASVSGINAAGPFDILPRHHNFISLLEPGELKLATPTGGLKIRIAGGVMHVHHDTVTVFLEV